MIERYIEDNSEVGTEAENALLTELERETNLRVVHPRMVSGRVQGALLTLITRILRPKLVLEIGTFTGYSALSIAAGLDEDAEIYTVEIDEELEDIARSFFDRSPHGNKIDLHIGSALETVPEIQKILRRPFDMIFIDGDKREYLAYYQMIMGGLGEIAKKPGVSEGRSGDGSDGLSIVGNNAPPMVRSGSIILADNVLWYGKVVGPALGEGGSTPLLGEDGIKSYRSVDKHTAGIVEFNRMVVADPRVENVILPLRDGINLIRVK